MRIWSHLLKKSLMENIIFCAVVVCLTVQHLWFISSLVTKIFLVVVFPIYSYKTSTCSSCVSGTVICLGFVELGVAKVMRLRICKKNMLIIHDWLLFWRSIWQDLVSWEMFVNFLFYVPLESFRYHLLERVLFKACKVPYHEYHLSNVILPNVCHLNT